MSKRKTNRNRGKPSHSGGAGQPPGGGSAWIYGRHAAMAALANPARDIRRIAAVASIADELAEIGGILPPGRPRPEVMEREALDKLLPRGTVHQGIALLAAPLPDRHVEDICQAAETETSAAVVILDQATDPHNVGAVLRSAAAFGAMAVITQDRHAPEVTGTMAKAASGALETVPLVSATNISRAMQQLKDAGFWCLGLDGEAETAIADADLSGKVALVIGAEGAGLRRLVRENCDILIRIPINPEMESLNLSTAAAVSLYEVRQRGK